MIESKKWQLKIDDDSFGFYWFVLTDALDPIGYQITGRECLSEAEAEDDAREFAAEHGFEIERSKP